MNTIYNKIAKTALVSLIAFSVQSCDDLTLLNQDLTQPPFNSDIDITDKEDNTKYADINLNYTISDENINELKQIESTIGSLFATMTYEGMYNDYQRTTNLTHDIYSGYVANNHQQFIYSSPSYRYTDGWSALRWTHFYSKRTLTEYYQLSKVFHFVDPAKYKNAFYITRIYWAYLALLNTDTYGSIPMSAYVKAKPIDSSKGIPYNTQEQCYDMIFRMLEQAVDSIQPDQCAYKFEQKNDRCYGGDERKWLRFANTLRLRMALRISNVDPERAKKEGEAALKNPWGLLKSDADNFRTVPRYAPFEMGGDNDGGGENAIALCSFVYNGDCVMNKDLERFYRNQSSGGALYTIQPDPSIWDPNDPNYREDPIDKKIDPRCIVSWTPPTAIDELDLGYAWDWTDYNGCEPGRTDVAHQATTKIYSVIHTNFKGDQKELEPLHWFSFSRESLWMGYAEVQFLLAEASLRGWSGAPNTPYNYYMDGIYASLNYYEIPQNQIRDYVDNLKIHQGTNPFNGTDKEAILEEIITQKWLAMFPNGVEAWAEFRRTDYPRLMTPLINSSGGDVPNGKFIKRISYPNNEAENNPLCPQDENSQGLRLWWDVADTNNDQGVRNTPNNFR